MLTTITALVLTTAAAAAPRPDQPDVHARIHKSTSVIRFFQNHRWMLATRHVRCADVPWARDCRIARRLVHQHRGLLRKARYERFHTLPRTNDWRTAVRIAQRVFPGTDDWLLYISHREGGWGPFVMNHQGSGAGGWMQFMAGTFYGYADDARAAVAARGFKVDAAVWEWTRPLGQALTAGYMRFSGRDGCHWCL